MPATRADTDRPVDATDIVATVTPPADRYEPESDWNWAAASTEAWLSAARNAGLTIDAESYDDCGWQFAGRVKVDGAWYYLESWRVAYGPDEIVVRAVAGPETSTATDPKEHRL